MPINYKEEIEKNKVKLEKLIPKSLKDLNKLNGEAYNLLAKKILESLAKLEHQELNKMPAKQPELSIPSKGKDNMVIGAQTSWGATFKLVSDDSYLKGKKGVFTKAEALAMTKLDEETKKACFDIKNTFDCYLLPDPIRVIKEVIRIFPNQKLKGWVPLNSSWMDKDKYTEPPQERE